jgi:predicted metal-dependent hydrolase
MSGTVTATGGNMLRNIIVGVITTVLGSTVVYFLGFHTKTAGSSADRLLITKENTIKIWKSYVTTENLYYQNLMDLKNDMAAKTTTSNYKDELQRFREDASNESTKYLNDIESFLKNPDIDESFVSLLKRRMDTEKQTMKIVDKLYEKIDSYQQTIPAGQEQTQKINDEINRFSSDSKPIMDRTKTEVTQLSKLLTEKYGQPFDVNDLLIFKNINPTNNTNTGNTSNTNYGNNNIAIDPKILEGSWDTPGALITWNADGTFNWNVTGSDQTSGSWRFYNNQLYMYPAASDKVPAGTVWLFNLLNVTQNSFTMQLSTQPYNSYSMTRK